MAHATTMQLVQQVLTSGINVTEASNGTAAAATSPFVVW